MPMPLEERARSEILSLCTLCFQCESTVSASFQITGGGELLPNYGRSWAQLKPKR